MRALSLLIVLAFVLQPRPSLGQEPAPPSAEAMQEMMQKWRATTTPGDEHAELMQLAGDYTITTKMFMGGTATPPTETSGTATLKPVLGDRFLQQTFKGEMLFPDEQGNVKSMPYEGVGMLGYDRFKKAYVGTWCDSMSTHLLSMQGSKPPTGNTIHFYGTMDEPMLDTVGRMVRYDLTINSADEFVYAIYDLHAGKEFKVIEIVYRRKQQ